MKPLLSIKTLLRSPARTVLIFILIAAVTFSLFSQIMEYTVTSREIKLAVEKYDGVVTVEVSALSEEAAQTGNPYYMFTDDRVNGEYLPEYWQERFGSLGYEHLTDEQIDALSELPYISYSDKRYMTAGFSEDYHRVDDGAEFYEYTHQCVVEATVEQINNDGIIVGDIELLGGTPRRPFGENSIYIVPEQTDATHLGLIAEREGLSRDKVIYTNGGGGVTNRIINFVTDNSEYDIEYLKGLEKGSRCVFVLRYEDYSDNLSSPLKYYLTDPFVGEYCDAVYCVDGEPENYLETEKFAPLRAYIASVEARDHTFDVVYTLNTGSIRYFSDRTVGISEGRGITPDDTEKGNNVCVVHHDMATELGLQVGDEFTLKLGDKLFEQYMPKGAISVSPETESENLTEVTLEIVGIFKDTRKDEIMRDDPCWSYSVNTVFVPSHLLNVSEEELAEHTFAPGEFSVVVDNAWDIPAFLEEGLPKLEEMGLTVYFTDGGWTDMLNDYKETERLSVIKIAVLLAAVIISTVFAAYLYIIGKRREFAIMRVLGTDSKRAGKALMLPFSLLTALAVMTGGAASVVYTTFNLKNNAAIQFLAQDSAVNTTLPVGAVVLCAVGEILLTLLIAFIQLGIINSNSPLALIQNNPVKLKKVKKSVKKTEIRETAPVKLGEWVSIPALERDGKDRSIKFVLRYVMRHIRRSTGKALLFILVSVMLLSVLGQLNIMGQAYLEIFESVEITSNYAGYLNFNYVSQLIESGYVEDVYYQNLSETTVEGIPTALYMTSDIERFTGENVEITYAEGYDVSVMQEVGNIVILGEKLMAELGVVPGDTVRLSDEGELRRIEDRFINRYIQKNGTPEGINKEELSQWKQKIIEENAEEIDSEFDKKADKFIVAGSLSSESEELEAAVFTPGTKYISNEYGILVILDIIEATVSDNRKVDKYREFGTELAAANLTGEIAFVMDDSKLDNVKNNVQIMDTLYPLVMAAVLLIGGFLCGIVIVQTSKDIAIMRILGTSKTKVRAVLITEQLVLCFAGVVLSAVILVLRNVSAAVLGKTAIAFVIYFAAIFAASYIAAYITTKKNALEMMHTKE